MKVGVYYLYFAVYAYIRSCYFAWAYGAYFKYLRLVGMQPYSKLLNIEYDFSNILFYTGDGGKLMLYAFDINTCNGSAGK